MSTATIADIFRYGFKQYVQRFGPQPLEVLKAVDAITTCRTETMGGHRYQCDRCGSELTLHNSCRNRNCPQCQGNARLCWIHDRIDDLLPVGYFHAVFTLPDLLNPFALRNKKVFYRIMFRAAKETLLTLAQDNKRLGATIGFITVLHTWGQTLIDHPHVHVIIPGGGLNNVGKWKACRKKFLFPVPVVRKMFRGKLMHYFIQAVKHGQIHLYGKLQQFNNRTLFRRLRETLYRKEWVVYIKPPFASPQAVVKYLGQYTHRIAISNHRIINFDNKNGTVTFSWKDYTDNYKRKQMTLNCVEFIRRFLMHVVPKGFVRIRHYGFLANRNRTTKLARCRAFFRKKPPQKRNGKRISWIEAFKKLHGYNPRRCRECLLGIMEIVGVIEPVRIVMTS
jgi:hypothetical protein